MVGGERGDLPQDGGPLEVIERAADALGRGQQDVILDVEDACGVVGALDRSTEPGEPEGVVAQHSPISGAVAAERDPLRPLYEADELLAAHLGAAGSLQLKPGPVDCLPYLDRDGGAHRTGVFARELNAVPDRR